VEGTGEANETLGSIGKSTGCVGKENG